MKYGLLFSLPIITIGLALYVFSIESHEYELGLEKTSQLPLKNETYSKPQQQELSEDIPTQKRKIKKLMQISGIEWQLSLLSQRFHEELNQDIFYNGLDEVGLNTLAPILKKYLAGPYIKNSLENNLMKNYSEKEIEDILNIYNSPLMEKVTQLEEFAQSPRGNEEMNEFARSTSKQPPSIERLEIIDQIDKNQRGTELNTLFLTQLIGSMFKARNHLLEEKVSDKEISNSLKNIPTILGPSISMAIKTHYLYAYQSLSIEELRQLAKINKNKTLRKVNDDIFSATKKTFNDLNSEIKDAF